MKAVDAGPGLKNTLGVNIDLNGFARGARAVIKQSVDIFKIRRGSIAGVRWFRRARPRDGNKK
jgi:hypothetical protein